MYILQGTSYQSFDHSSPYLRHTNTMLDYVHHARGMAMVRPWHVYGSSLFSAATHKQSSLKITGLIPELSNR